MLKAKKDILMTTKKEKAFKEASKGKERGFYALMPLPLFKKLNAHLATIGITKRQWLEQIARDL